MYNYNCPDCNEAKLNSDKNARKINEVIEQVNQIIDNQSATIEYLLEKADEIVEETAEIKVDEMIDEALGDFATKEELNVERVRINNLTKLSDGSTTGDAELIDARVGVDGYIYDNVGNAIRSQLSNTNNKLNKVYNAFSCISETNFDAIQSDTLYSPNFPNGNSFVNYKSYIKNVEEGEIYLVTSTTVANNLYCLALIYNSENEVIKVVEKNKDDNPVTFKDYEIIIPQGGVKIIMSAISSITNVSISKVEYKYEKKYEEIENICNKVETVFDDLLVGERENYIENCTIENNKIYSTEFTTGTVLNNFMTYSLNVNKGEVYEISTTLPGNTNYATVLFYKNGNYISYLDKNETAEERSVINYRFTVPDGVDEIKSSLKNDKSFSINKINFTTPNMTEIVNKLNSIGGNANFSYRVNGTSIEIISKSNGKDFYVQLMQKGGNNLFDFHRIGYINNTNKIPSSDFDRITQISSFTTDCHSPFVIYAKNNADGDQPGTNYFTGGNHQYNNQGSGSSATARQITLKFLIDGVEVKEGTGYGNKLEIQWSNNVQACNTTKADGTGREVLTEYHILTFDGGIWNSQVELKSLEDIQVTTCYGFQFVTHNINKIKYVGGSNRIEYTDLTKNNDCGTGKANKIIGLGDLYNFEMELDLGYDLGASTSYETPHSFYNNYGKVYFNLTNGIWINQGESYHYRGSYKFIIPNS